MSDLPPIDQTEFVEATPLRDEVNRKQRPLSAKKEDVSTPVAPATQPKKPPLLLYVAIGITVLLFITMLLVNSGRTRRRTTDTLPQASQTPTSGNKLPDELRKSIDTLDASIKAADPQSNDLPFPPVNFSLHLKIPTLSNN